MTTIDLKLPSLHAGQTRVRSSLARFNTLTCGRRWGKTEFGMHEAADTAINGKSVGWFAPTYKIMDEAFRTIRKRLGPIIDTDRSDMTQKRIVLLTGGSIEFWSLDNADAGRSRRYHLAIIDEAGIVRNLGWAWQASIRPTLTDFKGGALFLGTPKGRGEFIRMHGKGDAGDFGWASFRCATVENPYIDPDEVEDARRDLPDDIFAQEYEGVPADDGGNPFGLPAIAECVGAMSGNAPVVWGVDLAKSVDYTVAIGLDDAGSVCRLERWTKRPWSVQRTDLIELIGDTAAYIDSTGVGDPVVEDITKDCPRAEGFKFSSTSKQQLMEGLAAAIQTRAIQFPDGAIRSELEVFEYDYKGGRVSYSAPVGFHDDCVCALALAVHGMGEAAKRPGVWIPGGYMSGGRRQPNGWGVAS